MNLSGEPRLAAFKILSYEGMLINCSQSILFFAIIIYYNIILYNGVILEELNEYD
jgi:hypothetical protein